MDSLLDTIFPMRGWPIALILVLTQFIASTIVNLMSYKMLSRLYPIYKTRKFEKDGKIYQTIFHIKGWKEFIPSVSAFNKKTMEKRKKVTEEYVEQYLLEGVKAELCHDLAILFAVVIIIFSVPSAWFFIIAYTLLLNIPCIIVQRFNRPRFQKLAKSIDQKGNIDFTPFLITLKKPKEEKSDIVKDTASQEEEGKSEV